MKPEIEKIIKKIDKLQSQLESLQESCEHKLYNAKRGAITGNYDHYDDCYWVSVKCLECGKYMHFDSVKDRVNYNKYI